MLRMENLKYRKLLSLWGWSGDDTYFLDGHRLETLQMRDNVTEATLKMFGRTHHVTTAVYHLGLDANFTGWLLLETAGTGIHYPELLRRKHGQLVLEVKTKSLVDTEDTQDANEPQQLGEALKSNDWQTFKQKDSGDVST